MVAVHTAPKTQPRALPEGWVPLRPHPEQSRLWRTRHRHVKVTAGRISGKTTLARRRVVMHLQVEKPWPDPRYFYALPTYGWARKVAWEQIVALVPRRWVRKVNDSSMCITSVFGSKLYVLGLDKPSRVEGAEWDGCVIDESSNQKPGTYARSVAPALSVRKGWCWRIGAPKRYEPGGPEFREAFQEGVGDGSSFTWPSWDIADPEEIEILRKEMDPKDFAEQVGGNFQDAGGAAYHQWSRARNVRSCTWHRDKLMVIMSDFNVDPMAWCLGHLVDAPGLPGQQGLEVFDEIWLRDATTQGTLDVLWQRYGSSHRGGFVFAGDAAHARQRHTSAVKTDYRTILNDERYVGARVRYPKSNPAVRDRLAAVNRLLKDAAGNTRLWVDLRCRHLIDDMENRSLDEYGEPVPAQPGKQKTSGHISDALGYGVWKFFPIVVTRKGSGAVTLGR